MTRRLLITTLVVGTMIDEIRATQLESFALAGALVLLVIAAFFRSLTVDALAFVPTALPVLVTLGAMGLAGVPLDVGSAMVAAVILGLAVDDAIHLLSAWRRRRLAGDASDRAIAAAGAPRPPPASPLNEGLPIYEFEIVSTRATRPRCAAACSPNGRAPRAHRASRFRAPGTRPEPRASAAA